MGYGLGVFLLALGLILALPCTDAQRRRPDDARLDPRLAGVLVIALTAVQVNRAAANRRSRPPPTRGPPATTERRTESDPPPRRRSEPPRRSSELRPADFGVWGPGVALIVLAGCPRTGRPAVQRPRIQSARVNRPRRAAQRRTEKEPRMSIGTDAETKKKIIAEYATDRGRHRFARGPGRAAEPPHQPPDRAPQAAQARPPQPSWPAAPRRPASSPAELPAEDRHRALPLDRRASRPAPLSLGSGSPATGGPLRFGSVAARLDQDTSTTEHTPQERPADVRPGPR